MLIPTIIRNQAKTVEDTSREVKRYQPVPMPMRNPPRLRAVDVLIYILLVS